MLKLITINSPLILPSLGVSSPSICQDFLYSRPLSPPLSVLHGLLPITMASTTYYPRFPPPAQTPLLSPQVSISSCLLDKSARKFYRCPTLHMSMSGATPQTSFWQLSEAENTSATNSLFWMYIILSIKLSVGDG